MGIAVFAGHIGVAAGAEALTLEQALEQAASRNIDLKVARERLTQAQQLSRRAWALYLPQISIAGSYTYNNVEARVRLPTGYTVRDMGMPTSGGDLPGQPTNYTVLPSGFVEAVIQPQHAVGASGTVSQALIAPAAIGAIRAADLSIEVARLSTENVRREILFGVASAYYGAANLAQAVAIQQSLVDTAKVHEADSQRQFEAGAQTRLALRRAQTDRALRERDLERAKNAAEQARMSLATLLDRPADFTLVVPKPATLPADVAGSAPQVLQNLQSEALAARPDVRASHASTHAAAAAYTAVLLRYLPNVGLTGRYSVTNAQGFTGRYDTWFVQLGLSWTLWDGGLREADAREAASRRREAELVEQQTLRRARDEVEKGMLDVQSATASLAKAEESARLARDAKSLVEDAFKAGAATYLEVLDASTALATAEQTMLLEQLSLQLSTVRLLKSVGRFPQSQTN